MPMTETEIKSLKKQYVRVISWEKNCLIPYDLLGLKSEYTEKQLHARGSMSQLYIHTACNFEIFVYNNQFD